jgi:hypothetical protein
MSNKRTYEATSTPHEDEALFAEEQVSDSPETEADFVARLKHDVLDFDSHQIYDQFSTSYQLEPLACRLRPFFNRWTESNDERHSYDAAANLQAQWEWLCRFNCLLWDRMDENISVAEWYLLSRLREEVSVRKFEVLLDQRQLKLEQEVFSVLHADASSDEVTCSSRFSSCLDIDEFSVDYELLVLITLRRGIRNRLIAAFENDCGNLLIRRLLLYHRDENPSPDLLSVPTMLPPIEALRESAIILGRCLGSVAFIESVQFGLFNSTEPTAAGLLAAVVRQCRQFKNYYLFLDDYEVEDIAHIAAAINGHPSLETVQVTHAISSMRKLTLLVQSLTTLDKLRGFRIFPTKPSDRETRVISADDAMCFARVLQMRSMGAATLSGFTFTEVAADCFCRELATLNISDLSLHETSIPPTALVAMARALAASSLRTLYLDFSRLGTAEFALAFASGLNDSAAAATALDTLEISTFEPNGSPDKNAVALFLQHTQESRITRLTLSLFRDDWYFSDTEASVADFVAHSECLRTLEIRICGGDSLSSFNSNALVEAAWSGKGSLDKIQLECFEPELILRMEEAVKFNVNRQKRIHGHFFEDIANAVSKSDRFDKIVAALDSICDFTLADFLRSNEWGLCDLLLQEIPRDD